MPMPASLPLLSATPWAPREAIAPRANRDQTGFLITSNGSEGCYGGWELTFPAPETPCLSIRAAVRGQGLAHGSDCIQAAILWDGVESDLPLWDTLLPEQGENGETVYQVLAAKPEGATGLRLRLIMAWSGTGELRWSQPEVTEAPAPAPRPWRLGAAGGPLPEGERSVASNTKAYLQFCREAAASGVDLLCLPEVMLTSGLPSNEKTLPEQAFTIPGPEIEPFQAFAAENKMAICFSAWEKDAELIHNTAILIDKAGKLVGKYRKVHLASPWEVWWGVTPGKEFPVYDLGGARVAMNICMDSSALESARVPALQGAEILCMPIMGDHRAVLHWVPRQHGFDLDRWCAIQRVRAMDNQLHMLIARNQGIGSGVFAPNGEVLALAESGGVVHADIDLAALPRTWTGATFRGVAHWERRPPAYGPIVG